MSTAATAAHRHVGRSPAAVLIWAAAGVLIAAMTALPFTVPAAVVGGDLGYLLVDLVQGSVYLAVAGILVRRRVRGPVTVLLTAAGATGALAAGVNQYALAWLSGLPLPAGSWALWAQSWLYLPWLAMAAIILPLLLAKPARPQRFLWPAAIIITAHTIVLAVQPASLQRAGDWPNPLGIPAAAEALPIVTGASVTLMLTALTLLWRRWRHSHGPDRLALSWFLAGDLLLVAALLMDVSGLSHQSPYGSVLAWTTQLATLPLLPGAILVVALRGAVWPGRGAAGRALVWSLMSLGVAWAYAFTIGWLVTALRLRAGLELSILAAGIVALVFEPVRSRLQRAANHLAYGDRRDPLSVLSRLSAGLVNEDPGDFRAAVDGLTADLRLAGIKIDLARGNGWEHFTQSGAQTTGPIELSLPHNAEVVGRMHIHLRPGDQLRPADFELLGQVSRQLAAALVHRRQEIDLHRSRIVLVTARAEERRRLARDLHDDLGPTLAGIALGLRAASNNLAAGRADTVPALLAALSDQSTIAAEGIRRIALDLRSPWLQADDLLGALRQRISALRHDGAPHWSIDAPGELPALSAAVEVAAYRVTDEALTNVLRHADARNCHLTVSVRDDNLRVDIADDGVGLQALRRAGTGLTAMRERAEELGGSLELTSIPSSGTRVRLTLPLGSSLPSGPR
jgi:signal transduction histidine kinase